MPVTLLANTTVPRPGPRKAVLVVRLTVLLIMNMPPPCWTSIGVVPANVSAAPAKVSVPVDVLFSTIALLVKEPATPLVVRSFVAI